jgi:AcrR family transcriptional regulator
VDPTPTYSPRNESRRDRKRRATRNAIVGAARQLFTDQGYEATTLGQIADRADVASSTLFTHFTSKAAIFFADYDVLINDFIRELTNRNRDHESAIAVTVRWYTALDFRSLGVDPDWFGRIRRLIDADAELPFIQRQFDEPGAMALAAEVARDIGESQIDLRPQLVARMVHTVFVTMPRFRPPSHPDTSTRLNPAELSRFAGECISALANAIISVEVPVSSESRDLPAEDAV